MQEKATTGIVNSASYGSIVYIYSVLHCAQFVLS